MLPLTFGAETLPKLKNFTSKEENGIPGEWIGEDVRTRRRSYSADMCEWLNIHHSYIKVNMRIISRRILYMQTNPHLLMIWKKLITKVSVSHCAVRSMMLDSGDELQRGLMWDEIGNNYNSDPNQLDIVWEKMNVQPQFTNHNNTHIHMSSGETMSLLNRIMNASFLFL